MSDVTLSLLHGWGCDSGVWQPLFDGLGSSLSVQCFDIPFCRHGQPQQVDTICDQLAEQLPEKTLLCGWSLGGMLALRIAARYPEKVVGLVTLAANVSFVENPQWAYGMPAETFSGFCDLFKRSPEQALKRFMGLETFGDSHAREQKQWLQQLACSFNTDDLSAGLQLLATINNYNEYPRVSCLAWFCFGEKDSLVSVDAADHLVSLLSAQQKVKMLPNVGHLLHFPEQRMSAFLQQCMDEVRSSMRDR